VTEWHSPFKGSIILILLSASLNV